MPPRSSIEPASMSGLAGWVAGWLGGWHRQADIDEPARRCRLVDHRLVADAGSSIIDKPASRRAGIDERTGSRMHTKVSFWPCVVSRDTERRRKQAGSVRACVCVRIEGAGRACQGFRRIFLWASPSIGTRTQTDAQGVSIGPEVAVHKRPFSCRTNEKRRGEKFDLEKRLPLPAG